MKQKRNTIAKTKILDLINTAEVALSHAEIETLLDGLCNRVTIYRVLDRLVEEDLIHKVVNLEGGVKYAKCHHAHTDSAHLHNHIHFNCEKCHQVTCLEEIEPRFQLSDQYQVNEVNFVVSGLCPACK